MSQEVERIGDCTLYRGDCRDILPTLGPVDAVVADPPYGVGLKGKRSHSGTGMHTRTIVRGGTYTHEDTPHYVETVVVPAIAFCRKIAGCTVVMPGSRCLWLYPPADDLGCFFMGGGTGMNRWGFTCMQAILYYGVDPYQRHGLGCRPNSYGHTAHNDVNDYAHPCIKPLAMMLWLVNRASLQSEAVLDPFMGSGTTGVACVQLGRSFIGIEIEPRYFDIACQRIEEATRQGDLFVPLTPQRSSQPTLF